MRIAIMGSGGLGGFYGGKLANNGNDVSFVARGQHLKEIQHAGLKLVGPNEVISLQNLFATDKPEQIGKVDIILFCVKLYDVEIAAALIKPIVSKDTAVISLLNGINGPERLQAILKNELVFGGAARVSARISVPGVIDYLGENSSHGLVFGHPDNLKPQVLVDFCNRCNEAGFPAQITDKLEVELWDKLTQLACVAGLTTLARKPMGVVLNDPELFAVGQNILREVEAVARKKNISLDADIYEKKIRLIKSFPEGLYASMYHDLMARKRIEVEDVFGYLSNQGKKLSVKTPTIDFIYAFLRPYINGS